MVYDNSLDNQHQTTRKSARRWFEPYVVTSANDNDTYHLVELDGSRLTIPIAGKRVKIFKKRQNVSSMMTSMMKMVSRNPQT